MLSYLSTYYLNMKVSVQFPKPHPTHQVYLLTICENQPWGNAGCISKKINFKETITFDGKISYLDKHSSINLPLEIIE